MVEFGAIKADCATDETKSTGSGRVVQLCSWFSCLVLLSRGVATAQTFETLYTFTGGRDGGGPQCGLVVSNNVLIGSAGGGAFGSGTLFTLGVDGGGFTNFYDFSSPNCLTSCSNTDGLAPLGSLTRSTNILYGTTIGGGNSGNGTVFSVNLDGISFRVLHHFSATPSPFFQNFDGATPLGGLILCSNTLYGVASSGGSAGQGTVFKINTDGTSFAVLHAFTSTGQYGFNNDGAQPSSELVFSNGVLYGTAQAGGPFGSGTVFRLNADGTAFTTLHSFTPASSLALSTNSDGVGPVGALTLSGNTLYGTAQFGGASGCGTVFKLSTDGTEFTTLYWFSTAPNTLYPVNNDGAYPTAGVLLVDNTLVGSAHLGGDGGVGTIFTLSTNGAYFSTLHSFIEGALNESGTYTNGEGAQPNSRLVVSGNQVYGTTPFGGSLGVGTVFRITLPLAPPRLTISLAGENVILRWPSSSGAFILQSTTNLTASAIWLPVSQLPVVISGLNTVTDIVASAQQYYRLSD